MRICSHERLLRRFQAKDSLFGRRRHAQGPSGSHLLREPLLCKTWVGQPSKRFPGNILSSFTPYVIQYDPSASPKLYDQWAMSLAISCSALSVNLTSSDERSLLQRKKPRRRRSLN